MLRFVVRRLLSMLLVLFAISVLVVPHLLRHSRASTPRAGSPAETRRRRRSRQIRHEFGLDQPLPVRTR